MRMPSHPVTTRAPPARDDLAMRLPACEDVGMTTIEQPRAAQAQARQRAFRHVRQYPDPVLRRPTHEVTRFDDELALLAERMGAIMRDARGVGLAAPQVGHLLRMFTFQDHPDDPVQAVINPRITWSSEEVELDTEGCLSLATAEVAVTVQRPVAVKVEALDLDGDERTWELEGYLARVFQHEIDHLDGVLMIDRAERDQHLLETLRTLRPN